MKPMYRTQNGVLAVCSCARGEIAIPRLRRFTMADNTANTSRSITGETVEMSPAHKYLYDLTGYLVVRNALTPEQLRIANLAIGAWWLLSRRDRRRRQMQLPSAN